MYGIEVARAMGLGDDFIKKAHQLRRVLTGENQEIVDHRLSRYNSRMILDKCPVCKDKAVDTHHIKFQCNADGQGFVLDGVAKHDLNNLVGLCKKCHIKVHQKKLLVHGWAQTCEGRFLAYDRVEENFEEDRKLKELSLPKINNKSKETQKNKKKKQIKNNESDKTKKTLSLSLKPFN
jgi:DNA mismatch repair protein MutS